MEKKEQLIANLKLFDSGISASYLPDLPKASVLIPLLVKNGEVCTLMTLRSLEMRTHAGDVCFPGGRRDPSDRDEVDTALREAEEEIGLPPDGVQVVCKLLPIINKRGLLVTPVVGFIEESFCPRPNPAEVSAVFTVPLDFFTTKQDHSDVHTPLWPQSWFYSFNFADPASGREYFIYGITAVFAVMVACLGLRKNTEFAEGFDVEDLFSFFQCVLKRGISKL
ncbi:peroxisomal coenzyme A diphosphatase NUDT7 [Solea senegalensis]|uniref:Peroxisomal coenzyme A diphosphatase NUDT7 n=1 Tax=Solea senegalensis TaxID=28829 RepID=A0AAV6SY36_SOLSE|nr:peroxisomal coenzyme A diphosphatase NUDT7 [Solea senegalensis]KAG7522167.1 peroxisomal coenzyme A diphosphatase NUDT7 [Solea senegalensis]